MYEHAIPQNIMDYEFKLFAGLSLKQFIILALTGGISFAIFQLNQAGVLPDLFFWILLPTVVLGGVGLGLGTFQRRAFDEWIISFFRVINSPLRRVWKKDTQAVYKDNFMNTKAPSFPQYLSVYFLNEDEYRKLMQPSQSQQAIPSAMTVTPTIAITSENMNMYADQNIVLPMIPNTTAFRILQDGLPMDGVICYVKDALGNVVAALQSNQDGMLYFEQSFPNGNFIFEFRDDTDVLYPKVQLSFEGFTFPLINVTPLT